MIRRIKGIKNKKKLNMYIFYILLCRNMYVRDNMEYIIKEINNFSFVYYL